MQAAVVDSPGCLKIRDWPDPRLVNEDDVIISVRCAGICHSDVGVVEGHLNQNGRPLVPGHEIMGIVVQIGSGVRSVECGDRVVVNPLLTCGRCPRCRSGEETACESWFAGVGGCGSLGRVRDGGFAERIRVPERNVLCLPDTVTSTTGALLTDAGAVTLHAIRRLRPQAGETIVLVGMGGLGHCSLRYLALVGGLTVIAVDRDPRKAEAAVSAGADHGLVADRYTPDKVRAITGGRGADHAIDHSGSSSGVETAFACVRLRGTVVVTSCGTQRFSIPLSRFSLGEYSIVGAHGATHDELETAIRLAAQGDVGLDDVVTHRLALSDLPHALDLLAGKAEVAGPPPIRMVVDDFTS